MITILKKKLDIPHVRDKMLFFFEAIYLTKLVRFIYIVEN